MKNNEIFIAVLLTIIIGIFIPTNMHNNVNVNSPACHVNIKKHFRNSDIKFLRKTKDPDSEFAVEENIYLIDNKYTVSCFNNGQIQKKDYRKVIPINTLLMGENE